MQPRALIADDRDFDVLCFPVLRGEVLRRVINIDGRGGEGRGGGGDLNVCVTVRVIEPSNLHRPIRESGKLVKPPVSIEMIRAASVIGQLPLVKISLITKTN